MIVGYAASTAIGRALCAALGRDDLEERWNSSLGVDYSGDAYDRLAAAGAIGPEDDPQGRRYT